MDVYKIVGKLVLDGKEQFDNDVDDAKKKGNNLASSIGKGLQAVAKVGVAAVGVASAAIGALVKGSIESFAEYEQLAGGAQLLWGEAYDFVAEKARGAYATVQMSQNEYLRQMNTLSTGLITSLKGDEQAAAELADRIITAQADIVAATGASRESVENAFNGIMKSNFSMLDNLQLGITPTKEGFQTLIREVNAYNRTLGKTTNYQITNLADCQAALLDYIEMQGLSGYAADEAAETIEGSLSMMKASWQNLVVGMADSEADAEALIDNFVESTSTVAKRIVPRIFTAMKGIGKLVEGLAPVIAQALPSLVTELLPATISSAVSLLRSFGNALIQNGPAIIDAFLDALFTLLTDGLGMSEEVAGGIVGIFEKAISAVSPILDALWSVAQAVFFALSEAVSSLGITWDDVFSGINLAIDLLVQAVSIAADLIVQGINWLVAEAQTDGTFLNDVFLGIQGVVTSLWEFCVVAFEAISAAFSWVAEQANTDGTFLNDVWLGIQDCVSTVWSVIETVIKSALAGIQATIRTFTAILSGDWSGAWEIIKSTASSTWDAICSICSSIAEYISGFFGVMVEHGSQLIASLTEGIANTFSELYTLVGGWVTDNIVDPIVNMGTDLYNSGRELLSEFWNGLKDIWKRIEEWWDGLTFSKKETPPVEPGGTPAKNGLDYVPYDEFPAILHKGEAVLTAAEAAVWRAGKASNEGTVAEPQQRTSSQSGITIVQNIQAVPQTPAEFASATEAYFEQARWSFA